MVDRTAYRLLKDGAPLPLSPKALDLLILFLDRPAALVTKDDITLAFDDPGCLFHYMVQKAPAVRAMWFHDGAQDRWLREHDVAFAPGANSPMGSGLRPVPVGTPGALTVGEASTRALSP